ncbi:MAG: hypothetical protein ABEJ31_09115 [Haloarculaceae archaeon]
MSTTEAGFQTYEIRSGQPASATKRELPNQLVSSFGGRFAGSSFFTILGQSIECFVLEDVQVQGIDRVIAGPIQRAAGNDLLAARFDETDPRALPPGANPHQAIEAKNRFLRAVTGTTAEERKDKWENQAKQ